jgi:hypothetical protein
MALIVKLLGAKEINNSAATEALYTVPTSSAGAIVHNLRVVNTQTTGAINVNLYFTPSGGSQVRILDKDRSIAAGALLVVTPELTLGPGDKIELTPSTTSSYHYVVSGVERQT